MHHASHHQIHAMGAAIVERVRDEMREETAGTRTEQVFLVIRWLENRECLGMASLEDADSVSPELGLWLKESAHGQGFGREVVAVLVEWGHATLGKGSFIYPVAVQNNASRRIAENLHGKIIGNRTSFTGFPFTNRHILLSLLMTQQTRSSNAI